MDGYQKGTPQVLTERQLNYNLLKAQSGYFINMRITHDGIFRQFPLLSKRKENGVREFSNDIVDEVVFIDNIALEDAIEFQQIQFDILDGYYFNQGQNDKIKAVLEHLYTKRKLLEKDTHPAQLVVK